MQMYIKKGIKGILNANLPLYLIYIYIRATPNDSLQRHMQLKYLAILNYRTKSIAICYLALYIRSKKSDNSRITGY